MQQAQDASRDQLLRAMELFMRVESEMKFTTQARTMLELAAVRACHPEQEAEDNVMERIARMEKMLEGGVVPAKQAAAPAAPAANAAPAKPAAAPAVKPSAPAAKPPQEYLDAVERVGNENPSIRRMLDKMIFAGIENGLVKVEFAGDGLMVRRLLEAKISLFEQAFSDAFGMPMGVSMGIQGKAPAKTSAQAKNVIEQSYDIFGRDKIELTDD